MTTRTTSARVALAALIITLMAACSGEAETPPAEAPLTAESTVIAVSAVDFAYELSETPSAAGTYIFELTNNGSMGHDVVLEGGDGGSTSIVSPGGTDSFTVTLEPGTYTLYCSVGNHRAQGMEVTFTVS